MLLPLLFLLAAPASPGPDGLDREVKRFLDVLEAARSHAASPIEEETAIYDGALPAMLRTLDPHSVFFDPAQFEQLQHMEQSEQKGFGTVVSVLPGRVIILQALPSTPSARAGLAPGDEILAVNHVALARLPFDQIVQFLGQARQHEANLIVRRPGNARLLTFTLKPQLMDSPSVEHAFLLTPTIGYIRVASFDPKTGNDIQKAIDSLGGGKLHGLVLDLRNNPGGVVEAALQTASLFLKPGQRILTVRGRRGPDKNVDVPSFAKSYSFPLAVLVNEKTASAAEIVTGALQDHDRAVVIGLPTYGKGLVQTVYPLTGGAAMALTTAFYYTPSGRSIQHPLNNSQLLLSQSAPEYKTDSGRIVHGGGGIQPDIIAEPPIPSRLHQVLESSGLIPSFAIDYVEHHKLDPSFQVTPELLDEFEVYATARGIQPSVAEWQSESDWLSSRLNEEIQTQLGGLQKGDEVAVRRDPVVQTALDQLAKSGR
jgi:carboxyl-terminal processing protease